MLDFHNHMIPGVDDGCRSVDESMRALRVMQDQGITHVITTPHFRASVLQSPAEFAERMGRIDLAWGTLRSAVDESDLTIRVDRGVELALDVPRLPELDARVRLAGTRNVLVEFPSFSVPPNAQDALSAMRLAGIVPVVAHPERYENLGDALAVTSLWKRSGAALQVNAGSLTGGYGAAVQARAWKLLEAGAFDFLCSDYHGRGECQVAACRALMAERGAAEQFEVLTGVNGGRLLDGREPLPVAPLQPARGAWARVRGWFGQA